MGAVLGVIWHYTRGLLPYPDPFRRMRVRRHAAALVTVTQWPGDAATGPEAAQLAMLRLLWLQRKVRRAHQAEEAAYLARAALETCIVGLYCLFGDDAVAKLAAANYRAAGKSVSYLAAAGLMSMEAIDSAVASLGQTGPNLNISVLADALADRHSMPVVRDLYAAYYMPLSHFFVHANAFTFTRHVGPDGIPRRNPHQVWPRRSAVRLVDCCTGLLAGNIAKQAGQHSEAFIAYSQAHLDRLLTPALTMSIRGIRRSVRLRRIPLALRGVLALRAYTHGPGLADDPANQEARVRNGFKMVFGELIPEPPEGMFDAAIDGFVTAVLADMRDHAPQEPKPTAEEVGA
jgi:hypothetical protein